MNRRSFIGSLIGTVLSTPFFAKLISHPPQRVGKYPYRMMFRERTSGLLIQAPGIQDIIKVDGGWEFVAEPFKPERNLIVTKEVRLYTLDGRLIRASSMHADIHMILGDELHMTQKLTCDIPTKSPDELVDLFINGVKSRYYVTHKGKATDTIFES